ncbi:MAG: ethanolamine ammonia-lyase subunit EutC [Propionibacteriaceae bacterium]|jgi:ethanolamine ammonia-lyase small subunit|nr:ethanolamine ammonia-lyase subunit EutC [Propionibacteriaceae bacterium]
MNEQELRSLVQSTLAQMMSEPAFQQEPVGGPAGAARPSGAATVDPGEIPDIRAVDYRQVYAVPNPANPEGFQRIKATTWARLGQGRSGPRYTTAAVLRFLADNATAMDAVFNDVSPELIQRLGLFSVQTVCQSRDDFLTYPDKGAQFDPAVLAEIKAKCQPNPQVQVFVTDGLSSTAVEANVPDLLPAFQQGLKLKGLTMGTPFFVKYGRVRSMEPISEALGATVTCVLVGERPGLATAESLSAYLAYQAKVGMSEALRTCLSNIHKEGTNAAEAGAHLAELAAEMIRQKASGIDLQTT